MHELIERRLKELIPLCRRFHVAELELFGSALTTRFDPATSDLDFAVRFLPAAEDDPAGAFFGLKFALEDLFEKPVDLVMRKSIRNPYFRKALEASKTRLYAA